MLKRTNRSTFGWICATLAWLGGFTIPALAGEVDLFSSDQVLEEGEIALTGVGLRNLALEPISAWSFTVRHDPTRAELIYTALRERIVALDPEFSSVEILSDGYSIQVILEPDDASSDPYQYLQEAQYVPLVPPGESFATEILGDTDAPAVLPRVTRSGLEVIPSVGSATFEVRPPDFRFELPHVEVQYVPGIQSELFPVRLSLEQINPGPPMAVYGFVANVSFDSSFLEAVDGGLVGSVEATQPDFTQFILSPGRVIISMVIFLPAPPVYFIEPEDVAEIRFRVRPEAAFVDPIPLDIVDVPGDTSGTSTVVVGGDSLFVERQSGSVILIPPTFLRGDANADAAVDLGDPITTLAYLFAAGESPACLDACDANSDQALDVGDAIYLLQFLFDAGPPPSAPFPGCGSGTTALGCADSAACP